MEKQEANTEANPADTRPAAVPDPRIPIDDAPPRLGMWLVLLVSLLLYLPSIGNGFSMDDDPIASSQSSSYPGKDKMTTALFDDGTWAYVAKFFNNHYWYPETQNDELYRPFSVLSYSLVYRGIGKHLPPENEALPQHAVNVLLQTWAVWLVIRLLLAVGFSGMVSLIVGALFGVHAIHSEVVAGIIGRAEIFSLCFGAQAMLFIFKGTTASRVLAGLMLLVAFGSKEVALSWIPFTFCLLLARQWMRDLAIQRGSDSGAPFESMLKGKQLGMTILVLAVPTVIFFALRYKGVYLGEVKPADQIADWLSNPLVLEDTSVRMMTGIKIWGHGLLLCLLPFKLSALYSPDVFTIVDSPLDPGFLTSFTVLVAFLVCGLIYARRLPLLFLGMACFLGFSFITSNVPLGIGTIFGERLYYIPSLGICMLPAVAWPYLCRIGKRVFFVLAGAWCVFNIGMTLHRIPVFESSLTLFPHDVQVYPECIDLQVKTAKVLKQKSRDDEAKAQRHRAEAMSGSLSQAQANVARAQALEKSSKAAIEKALEHLEAALKMKDNLVHAHREFGDIYKDQGKYDLAIEAFKKTFGHGYSEPPGAESMAFKEIGHIYLIRARAEKDRDKKLAYLDKAETWYKKVFEVPPFACRMTANMGIGDCYIERATLETDDRKIMEWKSKAVQWFIRATTEFETITTGEALKRVFGHAFYKETALLPIQMQQELYGKANDIRIHDPHFRLPLAQGAFAYYADFPTEAIYRPLDRAITNIPEAERDAPYYKAHLFYADMLERRGEMRRWRQVLEMLLTRPEIEPKIKAVIREKLRERRP